VIQKSHLKKNILDQAIAVAMASDSPKRMGAILLKRNKVISAATNSYTKTHPIQKWAAERTARLYNQKDYSLKQYLHSEINAIIKAKGEPADTIVVCRIGGHGGKDLRDARPCRICSGFLIQHGVFHVHYSTNYGFLYEYWGN
jgi:deoxycytidylate deaminase